MATLPPFLCPQGVTSKTFKPARDTSLTVTAICDWHYENSGDHPLYVYVDEATDEVTTLPWWTPVQGIYRIARSVIKAFAALNIHETRPTIGLRDMRHIHWVSCVRTPSFSSRRSRPPQRWSISSKPPRFRLYLQTLETQICARNWTRRWWPTRVRPLARPYHPSFFGPRFFPAKTQPADIL
ncbi:hypothetical protein DFH09DRAFT_1129830 [Mycena vulgaris]|nr:hypothetical protein DFH09DRAFT_1129830 [Mycena vulgaris]